MCGLVELAREFIEKARGIEKSDDQHHIEGARTGAAK
jgi:hypothetical protein